MKDFHIEYFRTIERGVQTISQALFMSSQNVQLQAIFFLNRSAIDEVSPITPRKAALWIYKSIQQMRERHDFSLTKADERDLSLKLFGNACTLATMVRCFTLDLTPGGPFSEKMEKALR